MGTPLLLGAGSFGINYDPNANTYFNAVAAVGVTLTETQKNAYNQLVLDLKSYNIYTKFKALYPVLGGVAASHAINAITPGTYNLTFSSGITHSQNGMKSGGNSYANTNLAWSAISNTSDCHLSFYSRTNDTSNPDAGLYQSSPAAYTKLQIRNSSNLCYVNIGVVNAGLTTASNTDSLGFYIGSRTANNSTKLYKNGNSIYTDTQNLNAISNNPILIWNWNTTGGGGSSKENALFSLGNGLDATQSSNFYTAVNTFQTTLGRNV